MPANALGEWSKVSIGWFEAARQPQTNFPSFSICYSAIANYFPKKPQTIFWYRYSKLPILRSSKIPIQSRPALGGAEDGPLHRHPLRPEVFSCLLQNTEEGVLLHILAIPRIAETASFLGEKCRSQYDGAETH